jgi:hypothetical protein
MGFFGGLYNMIKKNNEDAVKYREEQKAKAKTQPVPATGMKKGGMVVKPKKLVKGSKEAKAYMAKIRAMKK